MKGSTRFTPVWNGLWCKKHRERLGPAWNLFGYLLSKANKMGEVATSYRAISDDTEESIRSLKFWMNILKTENYVSVQKTSGMFVTIHKFRPVNSARDCPTKGQDVAPSNEETKGKTLPQVDSTLPHRDQILPFRSGEAPKNTSVSRNSYNVLKDNKSILSSDLDFVQKIIALLNKETGLRFRPSTPATQRYILARQKEGFEFKDFVTVIKKKSSQWKDDPKMCGYLRPETLFGTKFEGYLNEPCNGNGNKPELTEGERLDREKRKQEANQKFEKSMGILQ